MKNSKKLKNKVLVFLATLLLVGQTVVPKSVVMAEELNRVELQEKTSSDTEQTEAVETDTTESSKEVEKPQVTSEPEKVLDEVAKANDSPKMTENEVVSIEDFLKSQNLIQGTDGKLYTTTDSNYVAEGSLNDIFSLGNSNRMKRSARAGINVNVPSWTNIANINMYFANGHSEWGWYGKRNDAGDTLWCIELGVVLSVGPNGGYVIKVSDTMLTKDISLAAYFGYYTKGKTLGNEFLTQMYIYELQGKAPTALSGDYTMADYNAHKKYIQDKVKQYNSAPVFDKTNVSVKVGESVTLTDTKGVFASYKDVSYKNETGAKIVKSGNKVTITPDKNSKDGYIYFQYNIDSSYVGTPLIYEHPYTQNTLWTMISDPNSVRIPIKVIKEGNVSVRKVDKDTKEPLQATFKATRLDTNEVREIETNVNGYADWYGLPDNAVIEFEEIIEPTGYVIDRTPIKVTAKAGQTIVQEFTNKKIMGSVKLIKYADEDWHTGVLNTFLSGAEFSLLSPDGKTVLQKAVTNEKGEVTFTDVEYGFGYIIRETQTPEGYEPVADQLVDITEDGQIIELTATDKVIREDMKLIKKDDESHLNILSKDAQFEIKNLQTGLKITQKDALGNETSIFTTNEKGEILLSKLPYGHYEISEVKAPWGYLQLTKPVGFFVDGTHNGLITIDITNKQAKGTVTMTKTGETAISVETKETEYGNLHLFNFAQKPLKDVTFDIFARKNIVSGDGKVHHKAGDLVATLTTDELGQFKSEALYIGSYFAKEKSAPNGFIIKEDEIDFTIDYEGQNVPLTSSSISAENNWNKVKVIVNKEDETLVGYEENAAVIETIPSEGKVFGLFMREGFEKDGDVLVPENGLVGIATTKEGQAIFEGQYPEGDYYAKELNSGNDHVISEKEYPVSLTPTDNREEQESNIFDNGTFQNNQNFNRMARYPIVNKLFLTDVPFEKINETSKLEEKAGYKFEFNELGEGAEFELRNSEQEPIQHIVIDENGIGIWKDLVVGTYFFNETKTSNDSLVLDKTIYRIEVTQEVTKIFDNETGTLIVEKDNTVTPESETESEKEDTETTEESEEVATNTEESTDVETEESTNESEEEAVAPVEPLFTIKNKAIRGSAELEKSDVSDGKLLPDTGIRITDEHGKVVVEGRTDSNGKFTFDELPKGKYNFQEFDAPKGYLIDTTPVPFEIKEDGEIIKCQMTNVKQVDKLRQTKAENTNRLIFVAVLVLAACSLSLVVIYYRKESFNQN